MTSDHGETYAGAGRSLGLPNVPCLDSPLELIRLWDDIAAQVMRFSTESAQKTLYNSLCALIIGPRGQRQ